MLLIAYTFPPVAGVGIERSLKHATYLPEFGWQPVVVGPANPGYRLVDHRTLERVPAGSAVHRARSLEPAHIRRAVGRLVRRSRAAPTASAAPVPAEPSPGGPRSALNAAWRAYVRLAFFPDEQIGWAPDAIRVALRAVAATPVAAIYSSGPPFTAHLVGAALHAATGLPWVADFRDPWIGNAYAAALPAPHRAARSWLECQVVARAAFSVFASSGVRDRYAHRYPALADRFITIHNGYDRSDIDAALGDEAPAGDTADGRFRLIFTGSLQGVPELRLFAAGMRALLARRPELRDRLRVRFVGWFSPEVEAEASALLGPLAPCVERLGFQQKARTLRLLRDADAALVLLAEGPGRADVPSAKLFDYLGLDRPVLAVAPPGEVRSILADLDWGVGVDPTPEAFADGVERIMVAYGRDAPADPLRRFERRGLSGRLASLLDAAVLGQAPTGSGSRERRPTPR